MLRGGVGGTPPAHIWLGVSAEDQATLDMRVPYLLDTPAAVRFVSLEPLLGPIDLRPRAASDQCIRCGAGPEGAHDHPDGYRTRGLDWVIVGGESGPGARPMHPDWVRQLRDQCAHAGVPFLFKQWGAWLPEGQFDATGFQWAPGQDGRAHWWMPEPPEGQSLPDGACSIAVGKRQAGRLLDHLEHNGMPA